MVYGLLTGSLISTLAGVYLPGKYCLLQSVETVFIKPVFIGDELQVNGTIETVDSTFKRITVKVAIYNQNKEKVLRGKYIASVLV